MPQFALGNLVTLVRALGFTVVALAILAWIGTPISIRLRAVNPPVMRIVMGPLVGWALLSASAYLVLPLYPYQAGLPIILAIFTIINIFLLYSARLTATKPTLRVLHSYVPAVILFLSLSLLVLFILLSPHIYHDTLPLFVDNADEQYFVELTDWLWANPQGWRLTGTPWTIERGWSYHLIVAFSRFVPWIDGYEVVALVGYIAITMAIVPVAGLIMDGTGASIRTSAIAATAVPLHGLVAWTPSYGFGPNAVAVAAFSWVLWAIGPALSNRSPSARNWASLAVGFALMAHTPLMAIPLLCLTTILGIHCVLQNDKWRRLRNLVLILSFGGLLAFGALIDVTRWAFGGDLAKLIRLAADPLETDGAGWGLTEFPSISTWLGTEIWSFIDLGALPIHLPWYVTLFSNTILIGVVCFGIFDPIYRKKSQVVVFLLVFLLLVGYCVYLKRFPLALYKIYTITVPICIFAFINGFEALRARLRYPNSKTIQLYPLSFYLLCGLLIAVYLMRSVQSLSFGFAPWAPTLSSDRVRDVRDAFNAMPDLSLPLEIPANLRLESKDEEYGIHAFPAAPKTKIQAERTGGQRISALIAHHARIQGRLLRGTFSTTLSNTVDPIFSDEFIDRYTVRDNNYSIHYADTDDSRLLYLNKTLSLYRISFKKYSQEIKLIDSFHSNWPTKIIAASSDRCNLLSSRELVQQSSCTDTFLSFATLSRSDLLISPFITCDSNPVSDMKMRIEAGFSWNIVSINDDHCRISIPPQINSPDSQLAVTAGSIVHRADVTSAQKEMRRFGVLHMGTQLQDGELTMRAQWAGPRVSTDRTRTRVRLGYGSMRKLVEVATDADPGQRFQTWEWRIRLNEVIKQTINGYDIPIPGGAIWNILNGTHFLHVLFTENEEIKEDRVIAQLTLSDGVITRVRDIQSLYFIPLYMDQSGLSALPDFSLIKKDNEDDIFLVYQGVRHWVVSLSEFDRLGLSWDNVQVLSNNDVDRIALGVPTTLVDLPTTRANLDENPHISDN